MRQKISISQMVCRFAGLPVCHKPKNHPIVFLIYS